MSAVIAEIKSEVNETLVKLLGELLEQAKAGDLHALAYAGSMSGFRSNRAFCYRENDDIYSLIGALETCKAELVSVMQDQ